MADSKMYIPVQEILGVRIKCKCGFAIGGTLDLLAGKTRLLARCPACDNSWVSGGENDFEKRNNATAVQVFLSQLDTFQKRMALPDQNYSFALEIEEQSKTG